MSIEYSKRVWANKELKGGKLLVMLALADHATKEGESYPGMPLLTEKTRLTDRQIRRVLNDLAAKGYIAIEERAIGRGKRPHYKLFPNEKADIASEEKRTFVPPLDKKADISDNKSGHFVNGKADISDADYSRVRSEPLIEPPIEPTDAGASAQSAPDIPTSIALAFRNFHDELLHDSANRTAVLMRAYLFCHGKEDAPDYGRLGAFAKRVGGAGMALELIWNCTSRPPNGKILDYLEVVYKARQGDRRKAQGESKVMGSLNAVDEYEQLLTVHGVAR